VLVKYWIPVSDSQVRPFVFAGPEVEFKVVGMKRLDLHGDVVASSPHR
jgi:hypothetical protein